jgi:hypothetical protein
MSQQLPIRGTAYKVEEMDEESLVYRRAAKTAIYLNDTATVIWKLCDGTRTVSEIAAVIAKSFPDEAVEQIDLDVRETVDQLIANGLIFLSESGDLDTKSAVEITEVEATR